MITKQEPALEFVSLHIYYYLFISDFWAKGRRVYCSTNEVWSYGYMCTANLWNASTHEIEPVSCWEWTYSFFGGFQVSSRTIYFHIDCIGIWNDNGLQKVSTFKKGRQTIFYFFLFGVFFCTWNYVSVSLQGKGCIAPKLSRAGTEESKTLRGKERRLHNYSGQICF